MTATWIRGAILLFVLANCINDSDSATNRMPDFSLPLALEDSRFLSVEAPTFEINATGPFQCGETIKEFSAEDLKKTTEEEASRFSDPTVASVIKTLLLPNMKYGIRYVKICSSCEAIAAREDIMDSIPEKTGANAFDTYCAPDSYGYNATMSGLLLLPTVPNPSGDGSLLKPGALMATVWGHSSLTESKKAPSSKGTSESPSWEYATSTGVAAAIAPDYMGYGESYQSHKSYIVKKAYQTSFIPLWFAAKDYIAQQSNCTAELIHRAITGGYSEGGYSSVAMSASLYKLGVEITTVLAGAGPYLPASQLVTSTIQNVDQGIFPPYFRWALALWGSAYSSTNPSVPNFGSGQDLLDENFPSGSDGRVQDWFLQGLSKKRINTFIPGDDPVILFRKELNDIVRDGLAANEPDISCFNPRYATDSRIDKLCEALLENDLWSIFESSPYPIVFCHSPDDTLVSIKNVPDLVHDSNMLELRQVRGTHAVGAAQQCVFSDLLYLSSSEFLQQSLVMSEDYDSVCQAIRSATTTNNNNNQYDPGTETNDNTSSSSSDDSAAYDNGNALSPTLSGEKNGTTIDENSTSPPFEYDDTLSSAENDGKDKNDTLSSSSSSFFVGKSGSFFGWQKLVLWSLLTALLVVL